ncbi:uncharacterized protein LOC136087865 isoform X2 [Hydra vulgaris]|uniref:Uncharacterized protein LOC136087865 isoform X2 n=1 Tax=Hydra vulgaris TaxID=6087 RepID=A0ABM4CZZ4_HYDVU
MLKVNNIKKLCDSIPQVVFNHIKYQEHPIHVEAINIQRKFNILFNNYSKCHNEMNSCHLFTEEKIKSFAVCELIKFFQSITPKMHILENHMGVFLSIWGVSLGLYGEQGGESIHAEFNNIERIYSSMSDIRKLESLMRDHFIRNSIMATSLKPPIIPRRKKTA